MAHWLSKQHVVGQAMFKAPITESKQVEHIVNERRILEEATSEFCVGMVRAYQDRNCLYLLQDLVPGELSACSRY